MSLAPFYQDELVTLYNADSVREIPNLGPVEAVITDPPYSSGGLFLLSRQADVRDKYQQSGAEQLPEFAGDTRDQRSFLKWCSLWLADCYQIAAPGALCAIFTDWRQLPSTTDALQCGGWTWRGVAVWDKTEASRPRPWLFRAQTEFVVFGTAGPARKHAEECPYPPGVLRARSSASEKVHIAQKPDDVMNWLVSATAKTDTILDPFAGSGSTLVAAKKLGRRAVGVEISREWCEVAARRLAQGVLI